MSSNNSPPVTLKKTPTLARLPQTEQHHTHFTATEAEQKYQLSLHIITHFNKYRKCCFQNKLEQLQVEHLWKHRKFLSISNSEATGGENRGQIWH